MSTTSKYDEVFDAQPRLVNKTWLVAIYALPVQIAYRQCAGTRCSKSWLRTPAVARPWSTCKSSSPPLHDDGHDREAHCSPRGMVPFQTAYLMVFGMMLSILAGNHALVRAPLPVTLCLMGVTEGFL